MHHCSTQWAYFLLGLKRRLEGGTGSPYGGAYEPISALSPGGSTDEAEHQAPQNLVRSLYESLMARGDLEAADRLLSPDYIDHDVPGHSGDGGREDLKQAVLAVRSAFPNIRPRLLHLFASGDLACVRFEASGTHSGVALMGVAASGRTMTWRELHLFRCAGGRIVEHWGVFDLWSITRQLGGPS